VRGAELHVLGDHAGLPAVELLDEGRRPTPFAADDQADLLEI